LHGFGECSHLTEYVALFKAPHAWAEGLMLVVFKPCQANFRAMPGPDAAVLANALTP